MGMMTRIGMKRKIKFENLVFGVRGSRGFNSEDEDICAELCVCLYNRGAPLYMEYI